MLQNTSLCGYCAEFIMQFIAYLQQHEQLILFKSFTYMDNLKTKVERKKVDRIWFVLFLKELYKEHV